MSNLSSENKQKPYAPVLVIAVSSRTLFDLSEEHDIYLNQGLDEYRDYQLRNESKPLNPGIAFSLVKKLLSIVHPETNAPLVEVVLISRNNGDTGLRIFNAIEHHQLNIERAAFSNGKSPYAYLKAFGAHLFLSAHNRDVELALQAGYAAAHFKVNKGHSDGNDQQVRIAFDGDAVLFSGDSEKIFEREGLLAFNQHESVNAHKPLQGGPFKGFLFALHKLQSIFQFSNNSPICIALITARCAPSHKRVILTLRSWEIKIDHALFLGGLDKSNFLEAFQADIFFDDQLTNINSASKKKLISGYVPTQSIKKNN